MNLVAHNITKAYGSQVVLDDVSLTLVPGEIVGLLGRNGAGKSTLLKILSGINRPDRGNIDETGQRLGYMSERNPLYMHMYVREYLQWIGAIKEVAHARERVDWVIKHVGLSDVTGKKISQLSKGYRQRVGLAATLLPDPEVIILDEPINGLDPIQIGEYRALIKSIAHDKIIILSSHLMQEIEALCDRVLILKDGQISGHGGGLGAGSIITFLHLNGDIDEHMLSSIEGVSSVSKEGKGRYQLKTSADGDVRPDIFDTVVAADLKILEMSQPKSSLNHLFD